VQVDDILNTYYNLVVRLKKLGTKGVISFVYFQKDVLYRQICDIRGLKASHGKTRNIYTKQMRWEIIPSFDVIFTQ